MEKKIGDNEIKNTDQAPYEREAGQYNFYNKLSGLLWFVFLALIMLIYFGFLPFPIGIPLIILVLYEDFIVLQRKQRALEPYIEERKEWMTNNRAIPLIEHYFTMKDYRTDQFIDPPEIREGHYQEEVTGDSKLSAVYRNTDFEWANLRHCYTYRSGMGMDKEEEITMIYEGSCLLCSLGKALSDEQRQQIFFALVKPPAIDQKGKNIRYLKYRTKVMPCEGDPSSILVLLPFDLDLCKEEDVLLLKRVLDAIIDTAEGF